MGVVEKAEHEADHDRADAALSKQRAGAADRVLVERHGDRAGRRQDAFVHRDPVAALDQRLALPGNVEMQAEIAWPLVTPDMEDVTKAMGGDHAAFRAIMLDRDVGGGRGAMHDHPDLGRLDPGAGADFLDALDNADGLVLQRRRNLVVEYASFTFENEIGIRPAHIHPNPDHVTPSCSFARRSMPPKSAGPSGPAWKGMNHAAAVFSAPRLSI